VLYNLILMSTAEFAQPRESKRTADLSITPPLGGAAINGFNGDGESHPFFSGTFPPHGKLNGYEKPIARTEANVHFMVPSSNGELVIKRQTSADILSVLEGRLETERALKERGNGVVDRRLALFVDRPDDSFVNEVSFVGFENRKNEQTDNYEPAALFLLDSLPEDGQLALDKQYIGIPLKEIVAILPAYNPEKDLSLPNSQAS
jgi:hypothetical protein